MRRIPPTAVGGFVSDPFYTEASLFSSARYARRRVSSGKPVEKDLNHPHTAVCGICHALAPMHDAVKISLLRLRRMLQGRAS